MIALDNARAALALETLVTHVDFRVTVLGVLTSRRGLAKIMTLHVALPGDSGHQVYAEAF